jgi:hypothetical protein
MLVLLCIGTGSTWAQDLSAERAHHVMIVKGVQLAALSGQRLDDYHLEAVSEGALHPIPFQFDEFDRQGNPYFAESGTPIAGQAGVMDGTDELVFMYRDAGDKRTTQMQPSAGSLALELQLQDGAQMRYVYLVKGGNGRSDRRYVNFDRTQMRAQTDDYSMQFGQDNLLQWQGLYYKHYQDPARNLIKGLDLNIHFTVFTPWTHATVTQDQLRPRIIGIKQGPVRTIVEMDTMVKVAGISFPFAKLRMSYLFSQGEMASVSWGQIPYVGLLMKAVYGSDFIDALNFNDLRGAKVMSGKGPREPGIVDGQLSAVEKQLAIGVIAGDPKRPQTLHLEDNYLCLDTGKGFVSLMLQEFYPESLGAGERKALEDNLALFSRVGGVQYQDDAAHGPELGYRMSLNTKDVHLDLTGSMEMRFGVRRFFLPALDEEGPARFEREFRHPPAVHVNSI